MKLFRLDFGIKDRYRRGLADTSGRMHRSPQSETDPRHLAASPSSPSALFSAIASTSHARDEPMEQWNQFGSSALEAANAQPQAHRSYSRGGTGGGRGHHGQDYGYDDDQEDDHSNDGYMSSSSSSSLSSGSLASCSSLSPSSSDDDDDDYGDEDDDMQGGAGGGGVSSSTGDGYYSGDNDTQENDLSGSNGKHARQRVHFDYYGGRREMNEHGGLLPAAPTPAIEPLSDLLELIREEAEKERRRQPGEDEEDEEDEEDDDEDDEDDKDNEEDEEDEEDEEGDEYEDKDDSDEEESGRDGHSSDDGHDSSSMDESDSDRDSDQYDFYRGYNHYPPQDKDYSDDEVGMEQEEAGAATDWYRLYDHEAEADATLLSVDELHSDRLHPLALPPGRYDTCNYSSSSAMGGFDNAQFSKIRLLTICYQL
ncbi:hypothetical protein BGZ68_005821 [Mortierella alpina]|nr:hypothetical protein BGZ68_005821 [Mortierella alpina]